MNKYVKEFFLRGLMFGGFGPIVTAIILFIISKTVGGITFPGEELLIATVSTYLLAFIQAGSSVFNVIEEWPIMKSVFFHFLSLFSVYSFVYLINSWIPFNINAYLGFTLIFVLIYLAVWLVVYFSVKGVSRKLNEKLN